MRRLLLPALLAATRTAAGSGGSGSGSGGTTTASDGKSLFKGKCGACHTLKAAGTGGSFGPNLDDIKPDKATVLTTIKNGPGAMPNDLYTGADAEKVAEFVSSNAGR